MPTFGSNENCCFSHHKQKKWGSISGFGEFLEHVGMNVDIQEWNYLTTTTFTKGKLFNTFHRKLILGKQQI